MDFALPLFLHGHEREAARHKGVSLSEAARGRLVRLLYADVLLAEPWKDFLDMVLHVTAGNRAEIIVSDGRGPVLHVERGRWHGHAYPFGAAPPVRGSLAIPDMHLFPRRRPEFATLAFVSEAGWSGRLRITDGDKSETDGMFRWLDGHFEEALTLHMGHRRARVVADAAAAALDRAPAGVFLVDREGRILHANAAAARFVAGEGRDGLFATAAHGRRLRLSDPAGDHRFRSCLADVLRAAAGDASRSMTLVPDGLRGVGLFLSSVRGTTGEAGAVVHVADPDSLMPVEERLETLFGLRPHEAQLACQLATGKSLCEAAVALGLTESTVRTYCKTTMAKIGVRRQAELVHVVLGSAAVAG